MKKLVIHEGKNIQLIHYMPFDEKEGFGKTEEELKKMGSLVDNIPEPEHIEGYFAKSFWDEDKKEVYYEYFEIVDDEIS